MLASALAPPASFVACDVGGSAFAKCRRLLGARLAQRCPLVALVLERVNPLTKLPTALLRFLSGSL
jgi:hypothetical protein